MDDAFYVFQVQGGLAANALARLLPTHMDSAMCVVDWMQTPYDVSAEMLTLFLLGNVVLDFKSVLLLNHGARGPLTSRANGAWLDVYSRLFDDARVAIAGPRLSCEQGPHVQTHAYALSSRALAAVLSHELSVSEAALRDKNKFIAHAEIGLSRVLRSQGWTIMSIASDSRALGVEAVCNASVSFSRYAEQPQHANQVFYKFGGSPLRRRGLCQDAPRTREQRRFVAWFRDVRLAVGLVHNLTAALVGQVPGLHWPEQLCASGDASWANEAVQM